MAPKKPVIKNTIYLNTDINCNKTTNGATKNIEFSWNINNLKIDDLATLKVVNFSKQGAESTNNIITLRIKDIQFSNRNYFSSDNISSPIIFNSSFSGNPFWNGEASINVIPQIINNLTLIASDDITNPNAGIDDTVKFLIGIEIEEYDIRYTDIGNPYGEQRLKTIDNKLY